MRTKRLKASKVLMTQVFSVSEDISFFANSKNTGFTNDVFEKSVFYNFAVPYLRKFFRKFSRISANRTKNSALLKSTVSCLN